MYDLNERAGGRFIDGDGDGGRPAAVARHLDARQAGGYDASDSPDTADSSDASDSSDSALGMIRRLAVRAGRLAATGFCDLDATQRMEALRALATVDRFVDATEARLLAGLDARQGTDSLVGQRTTTWLAQHHGLPGWQAEARVATAESLANHFDRFAEALRRSEIDWSYCRALDAASNDRIVDALVDLQDELLARIPGRRYETWVRELRALCALLDADGPEPEPGERDRVHLSETLDGLVDLRGTFVGSTAEELRQLLETETDRQHRIAQHDREQTPDLPMPTRTVLRARALLAVLRRDAAGDGDAPETHVNLDVEALGADDGQDRSATSGANAGQNAEAADPFQDPAEPFQDPHERSTDQHLHPGHNGAACRPTQPEPDSRRPAPAVCGSCPPAPEPGETSRAWFRRVLGQRGHVLAPSARLADGNLRRLLCSPVIHAIITGHGHEVLHMGRSARLATPAQRRAARVRDGGCVFPGCDAPQRWTHLHHVIPWNDGGTTDLPLLATLCTHHHGITHRTGWKMHPNLDPEGNPNGTFHWHTPTGHRLWSQQHGEWAPDPP
ncbi:MAG: HNH endonuclease [Microthrixaceae bacterium]